MTFSLVRRALLTAALLVPLLLSGCWDKDELNELAVVIGVGLDKKSDHNYEVTAQVIKPSPGGQGGGGQGGGAEVPTWSLSANGKTVMDAIHQLNKISPRQMYWSHLQLIIFGEDLAKEGIAPVINWFERDRRSRSGTYTVVTHGTAEDLLNQKIELGKVPAKAMADLLETSDDRQLSARKTSLRDLLARLSTPGIDVSMDVIDPRKIRGQVETYELTGTAFFKNDRLQGYLTGQEATAVEFIEGKINEGVLLVPCPNQPDEWVTFQITQIRSRLTVDAADGKVKPKADLQLEGNFGDQTCAADLQDPKDRMRLQEDIEKAVIKSIQTAYKQTVELETDLFGIGRELRRRHPKVWQQKNATGWNKQLSEIPLDLTVKVEIRRPGLIFQPTPTKIK